MSEKRKAGRPKGTRNIDRALFIEKAKELKCDFFEILCLFAKGDWEALGYDSEKYVCQRTELGELMKYTIDPSIRAKCAIEGVSYILPKLKAIEISSDPESPFEARISLTLEDRKKLIEAARKNAGNS